jgi:hypothetical protein
MSALESARVTQPSVTPRESRYPRSAGSRALDARRYATPAETHLISLSRVCACAHAGGRTDEGVSFLCNYVTSKGKSKEQQVTAAFSRYAARYATVPQRVTARLLSDLRIEVAHA